MKVINVKIKKVRFLQRLLEKRFLLGFRTISTRKTLFDGRLLYLTNDFCARTDKENTRYSLNRDFLKKDSYAKPDLQDYSLSDSYSFLIITDIHMRQENSRSFEHLHHIIQKDDAFLVLNGDITQSGTQKQYDLFLSIVQKMKIPVYPVIGNHDIYFTAWNLWQKLIGNTIYRIDSGNTTLIMLDSANGRFGQQQIRWLEKQLQNTHKNLFIFNHCNFFIPKITTFQQFAALSEKMHLLHLLQNKAVAVFTGHSHKQHIHVAHNVPYINLDDFRHNSSYCRVYVSPKGIRYEYGTLDINKT